jgi:acetoin utilization deacetylase AcuC-like enzyme
LTCSSGAAREGERVGLVLTDIGPHRLDAMKVFYSDQFVSAGYAFDTTRKANWIADSIADSPITGLELAKPPPLHPDLVLKSHDLEYVRAVETGAPRHLAESQGFLWDAGLWPAVLASNGGAVAAALHALEHGVAGSLSSGLHHARRERGAGYCTFNGLILAAREALSAGARSILILDLDAHCGGGSASMIADDEGIWQVDVAVNRFDSYERCGHAGLALVGDAADYLPTIARCLEAIARGERQFDLCLYNAGMDPYEGCAIGGLCGITRDALAKRERMVFEWCRTHDLPIAFVLAGGYVGSRLSKAELVDLHRLTLSSAVRVRQNSPGLRGSFES